jgi:hypothetical protein
MKLWILAGLFTALWAPLAAAETTTVNCDVDDTQRSVQQRVDAAPAPAAPARTVRGGASSSGGQRGEVAVAPTPRNEAARRRGVSRRIPDAELIGGRGAL